MTIILCKFPVVSEKASRGGYTAGATRNPAMRTACTELILRNAPTVGDRDANAGMSDGGNLPK